MSKLQFLIPEKDINLRIGRILVIISELSYSVRGNPILDIERLSLFDFLIRYPNVLKQVKILNNDKDKLNLLDEELGNIESKFPNNHSLYNYDYLYEILKNSLSYKLVAVQNNNQNFYYYITEIGKEFSENLNSAYLIRVKELCEFMMQYRSIKTNKLKQMIKFSMEGNSNDDIS